MKFIIFSVALAFLAATVVASDFNFDLHNDTVCVQFGDNDTDGTVIRYCSPVIPTDEKFRDYLKYVADNIDTEKVNHGRKVMKALITGEGDKLEKLCSGWFC